MVATCTEEEEWEEEWGICIKLDPSLPEDVFGKGSGEFPRAFVFFIAFPKTEILHFLFLKTSRTF